MRQLLGSLVLSILLFSLSFPQDFDYQPHSENKEIIKHKGFTQSYIGKYEELEWVAYKLAKDMLGGENERINKFISDPLVPTGYAMAQDCKKSGYDKGHCCPAAELNGMCELPLARRTKRLYKAKLDEVYQ